MNKQSYMRIKQSQPLMGTICVDGAKNSLLSLIPTSLLAIGKSILYHIPPISDVYASINLLKVFGANVDYNEKEKTLSIDTTHCSLVLPQRELFSTFRTSILFAGACIKRFGEFWLAMPGGDKIGTRGINIHLDAFKAFGVSICSNREEGYLYLSIKKKLEPIEFFLEYPSVGATQNIILLASQIEGRSTLYNAAQEPEIYELIEVLILMGAQITCLPAGTIIIYGSEHLKAFEFTVMPDRLEAATYMIAALMTNGSVSIPNAPHFAMKSMIDKLSQMGYAISKIGNEFGIVCVGSDEKKKPGYIKTMPYPGFSSDYQACMSALFLTCSGESIIHETVFDERLHHIKEFKKLGADIIIKNNMVAHIYGDKKLIGTDVFANDIRAAAALILAGLISEGETRVYNIHHLFRGYAYFENKLCSLGANIQYIHDPIENNDIALS